MSAIGWEEFWWNRITGPHSIVTKVSDLLLDKTMVVLNIPADLPWRHEMRSAIETTFKLRSESYGKIIYTIDAVDDCPLEVEPGRYLLQRFAPVGIQKAYREKSNISIQEYIVKHSILYNTIVWIKGLTVSGAEKWLKFCRGYSPNSIEDGLFVLEVHGKLFIQDTRKIKMIDYLNSVSNYDLQLFNSFLLDEQSAYGYVWKRYISTLAASLCEIDAEISEVLLRVTDFTSEEPILGVRRIAELPDFHLRGEESRNHVLSCFRTGNISELNKRIWTAQLQVLFPLIELERLEIVSRWSSEINVALAKNPIVQYGQRLTDPLDVELGTLVYHISHKSSDGNYYIFLPDDKARDRLRFLHECRNILAHTNCLSVEQVKTILFLL